MSNKTQRRLLISTLIALMLVGFIISGAAGRVIMGVSFLLAAISQAFQIRKNAPANRSVWKRAGEFNFVFFYAAIGVMYPLSPFIFPAAFLMEFQLFCAFVLPIGFAIGEARLQAQLRGRAREGRCITCGYDLRATPERCPECGAITPPTTPCANCERNVPNLFQDCPWCQRKMPATSTA